METKCPICQAEVTRVLDLTEEETKECGCGNEYYRHSGKKLVKITNPKTPTDANKEKEDSTLLF